MVCSAKIRKKSENIKGKGRKFCNKKEGRS